MSELPVLIATAMFRFARRTRCGAALAGALLGVLPLFVAAQDWPSVALPQEVRAFDVGQQVTVNGLSMRLRGFVSASGPTMVADKFRRLLGSPLVENVVAGRVVLGRVEGDHYVSVQIERAGQTGSRGIVAVTQLRLAGDGVQAARESAQRWLDRLPAGSRLVSQMESIDGPKQSRHLVIANSQTEAVNRDQLVRLMAEEGLRFEREGVPDAGGGTPNEAPYPSGRLIFFRGQGKEAMATIRAGNDQTTVVFNIVTTAEPSR